MLMKINKFAAWGAVFGIIAALSIFLPWAAESFMDWDSSYSGWNMVDVGESFGLYLMPLAVAALGIFFAGVMIKAPKGNVTVAIAIIAGLAVIALALYIPHAFSTFVEDGSLAGVTEMGSSWGAFVTVFAGFGMFVSGYLAE
jgi:hypothetical protein